MDENQVSKLSTKVDNLITTVTDTLLMLDQPPTSFKNIVFLQTSQAFSLKLFAPHKDFDNVLVREVNVLDKRFIMPKCLDVMYGRFLD
ncbi:hypothetical protein GDO78_016216 [Eleutherodactylus coqui]|uniref:Uncharacterized protein n=1 Tax=Eleutherodactylus coqui TaxID=57060 RepID=A0A8J6E874_ELECQ|nr:hypothetical protein GDO78_016216 [Eleutherodactylus coqui]